MNIPFLNDEFWYGGAVRDGTALPLSAQADRAFELAPNRTPNQAMPLFLSSKGRYLWLGEAARVAFRKGMVICPEGVELAETGGGLREAYLAAMEAHFPFEGTMPAPELFQAPIFNTWIELTFFESQAAVLRYARSILENGFQPGVLMIDDGWSESYGDWRFHSGRFPQPRQMLDELHGMGFKVMLWVAPYITADTVAYRHAQSQGFLVREAGGEPYLARWWNGCSAVLDVSNPSAAAWLQGQLQALQALGVDGFKFDGGDPLYARADNLTAAGLTPNGQCQAWNKFGERYAFNEYRSAWQAGGRPLFQRLCDKKHSWGENGLAALVPDTLAQGITGHPFVCADMVGGGEYTDFLDSSARLDGELFVKHSGVSCLMPSIQFSAAPWRVLTEEENRQIHAQLALREAWLPLIRAEVQAAARTGEPAVRYMIYEFPDEPVQNITDQFMLGSRLLVAPLLEKGASERMVYLPRGEWRRNGEVLAGSGLVRLKSQDGLPIVLERVQS